MGVIIDTCIWIDVERGALTHIQVADATNNMAAYLSPPVIAELEYGVNRAKTAALRNKRRAALLKIKKKPCLIIDKDTGDIFGKLAAELDSAGHPSTHRINDLWIASLAIQNNMHLLTHNINDFKDIPGLKLLPPI